MFCQPHSQTSDEMNYTKTFQYKAVQYNTTNNYDLNNNNCWINPSLAVSPAAGDYNLPNCRTCGRSDVLDCIQSYKHTKKHEPLTQTTHLL